MEGGKQVYIGVELGVNYVAHIYTLAGAGFRDEDYIKKYGDAIPPEDREYLQNHSQYMSFAEFDHATFAMQLFFVPSYFNLKTRRDFEEYFQAWKEATEKKSPLPLEKYRSYFYDYNEMFKADKDEWDKILEVVPIFDRIGEIYMNNIEHYSKNIWPEIEPKLLKKSQELNEKIEDGLVEKWESVTGYKFKKDKYCVVLFYAGADGPSFNNLSLDKNTAYYGLDEQYMLDMISHELGIHILLPHLWDLVEKYRKEIPRINVPNIYGNISYMALESLASFYNKKVLPGETMDTFSHLDFDKFYNIYSQLYAANLEPRNMYKEGVKRYLGLKGRFMGGK